MMAHFNFIEPVYNDPAEGRNYIASIKGRAGVFNGHGLPQEYKNASIEQCAESIAEYSNSLLNGCKDDLLLVGDAGRGKTYAAAAILNRVKDSLGVAFVSEVQLCKDARNKYREPSAIEEYGTPHLLIVDDICKTKWGGETLFSIIERRRAKGRPTIYTSQYVAQSMHNRICADSDKETADAIISRLSACKVIRFTGKDRRACHNVQTI